MADQGIASSTNFVLNILLARWLLVNEYGAYSVCWSILLVLAAFHNALILEPMTVVGPAEFQDKLPAYLRRNYRLNWIVSLALAGVALIASFLYHDPLVRTALRILTICIPGYFVLLTVRRRQYVVNQPSTAVLISVIYSLLVFSFIAGLRYFGKLNASFGVAAFGMAWFAVLFIRSRPGDEIVHWKRVTREHWRYGRWIFASAVLAVGASDLQTLLLSVLVDLKAAGALRALMNFTLPISQLLTVLSVYALPRLSSRAKTLGRQTLLRQGLFFPAALIAGTLAYLTALVFFSRQLEHLLYGGKMQAYVQWTPLLAASAFVAGVGASFSTLLRAVQNSQHVFFAGIAGTVTGVIGAFALQRNWGIGGALWSLLGANTATTLVVVGTYIYLVRRSNA